MKLFPAVSLCLAVFVVFCPLSKVGAQSFSGVTLSKNVITDAFTNPAYVVNEDDMQVNLFGASGYAGSNAYELQKQGISSLLNGVSNPYFIKSTNHGNKAIWGNADILGPAASFKIKKKYYLGVFTRLRYIMNIDNLNDDAFRLMGGQPADTSKLYNLNKFSFANQLFAQVGVAYGGIIAQNEENLFTGGITANYMVGYAAAGVTVPQASFKVDKQNILYDMQGNVNVAFTPYANKWLSKGSPLSNFANTQTGRGFGIDMGVVYEYRQLVGMETKSDYLVRFAGSITDIGGISYVASTTTGSYTGREGAYGIYSVNKDATKTYGQAINQLQTDSAITQTGKASRFKVTLPTAMHLSMDLKLGTHFYLNANALINLRSASTDKYVTHYITSGGLGLRYETKYFALAIPFAVNAERAGNMGLIAYVGPFYIGSTSLVTPVLGNTVNNFDVFTGVHFVLNKRKRDY